MSLACLKAYDVRGKVPDDLDDSLAYNIGLAYAAYVQPSSVAIGRDVRSSSQAIAGALARGLQFGGANVYDLGLCGTEEIYFATAARGLGGGIMVTASHNPPEYNGMKFVREESRPISGDSGLKDIQSLIESGKTAPAGRRGGYQTLDNR